MQLTVVNLFPTQTDSPHTGLILLLVAFIMRLYVECSDPTPRMDGHLPKSSQLPSFSPQV